MGPRHAWALAGRLNESVPLEDAHHGFQPPFRPAAREIALAVQGGGDAAQRVSAAAQDPDRRQRSVLPGVSLEMDTIPGQPETPSSA